MLMDLRPEAWREAPPLPSRSMLQMQNPTPPPVPPKVPHEVVSRPMPPSTLALATSMPALSSDLVDITPNEVTPTTSTFSTSHADLLSLDQVEVHSQTSTPSFVESPAHSRSSTPSIVASLPAAASLSQQQSYFSVNEWAENARASLYTPPRAQMPTMAQTPPIVLPETESSSAMNAMQRPGVEVAGENESHTVSEDDTRYGFESDSEMDVISQISEDGQMTPVSWTEVGSTFSDDER